MDEELNDFISLQAKAMRSMKILKGHKWTAQLLITHIGKQGVEVIDFWLSFFIIKFSVAIFYFYTEKIILCKANWLQKNKIKSFEIHAMEVFIFFKTWLRFQFLIPRFAFH